MKDLIKDTPETDEFEPIELGAVSEETKGGQHPDTEFQNYTYNSMLA